MMLVLRVECLLGAAQTAVRAGDLATATRMQAEAIKATVEVRELTAKGMNQ